VVRLVLVPALMAMFDQWNWWLPNWLGRILPSVDFEKPLPKVDLGDLVIIPDDISALVAPGGDMRMVVKSAAKLKYLAPDAITVADPLAFSGCAGLGDLHGKVKGSDDARAHKAAQARIGAALTRSGGGRSLGSGNGEKSRGSGRSPRPVHPVTMWRGRLSVALDALDDAAQHASEVTNSTLRRSSPMETTNVQLPTGDRLQIPTGAETLRLKGYLLMSRNSSRDYAEFADLCEAMDPQTAAVVLAGMDRYYCGQRSNRLWVATQLVRRLADPRPFDVDGVTGPDGEAHWERVRQRCLAVAVAMLEEAR
jgi:RND superfamily putative drug exporter